MNRTAKIIGNCAARSATPRYCCAFRVFRYSSRSPGTRPLWRQQSTPQQIQVRQRKGGVQPCGVLRQPTVANLAKAPQALDHMKDVLDTGSGRGTPTVDDPLVLGQRSARTAPIDPISDAGRQRALSMRLVPVGLIAEHLS